jgi:hypothetical protein
MSTLILLLILKMGSSESTSGYRIIQTAPSSPAQIVGLTPYVDFIVSANGVPLSRDQTLNQIISKSLNCKVQLKVFSILSSAFRTLTVTPSNSWGGDGLIGAAVRWEDWQSCDGLRVLEVKPDSVALKLGLRPNTDYILGTENQSINDVSTFESILQRGGKFELFVLSAENGKVRQITIENCSGLGCVVGDGMINSVKQAEIGEEVEKEEEKVVVTVLQKKENELPPPPPPAVVKEKAKICGVVSVGPPPSIYDLSMESLTFQPKVLLSKYIQIR